MSLLERYERNAVLLDRPRELPRQVRESLARAGVLRFLGLPQPEMADAHTNFAYSTVATAPSPASSGTSLVVHAGDGALFPAVPFNATVWPAGAQPLASNAEIVRVTARSTDTLTIVRAQESSSARSIVVGDQIAATVTAKTLTDVETFMNPTNGLLPAGAKRQTVPRWTVNSATTLVSGTLRLVGIELLKGETYTTVSFTTNNTAMATGTHQIFGIFDDHLGSSGGAAYALLAQTSDDTSTAWAANTVKTLTLTSSFTPVRTGFFYLGALVVATTVPNLGGVAAGGSYNALAPVTGGASSSGLTALPNPAAAPSGQNTLPWAYVS